MVVCNRTMQHNVREFSVIPCATVMRHVDELLQDHACLAEHHCRIIAAGRREAQETAFGGEHRLRAFEAFYRWLNAAIAIPLDIDTLVDAREALASAAIHAASSTSCRVAVCPDAVCRAASLRHAAARFSTAC